MIEFLFYLSSPDDLAPGLSWMAEAGLAYEYGVAEIDGSTMITVHVATADRMVLHHARPDGWQMRSSGPVEDIPQPDEITRAKSASRANLESKR